MENGVQAFIMAFAVFIFVIALTVSFMTINQAKHTADVVLYYSDREVFQDPLETNYETYEGRVVNVDTIIATIYRCIREKFTIKIIDKDGTEYIYEYDALPKNSTVTDINLAIRNEIDRFVKNHKGETFREKYIETIVNGHIYTGEDGTTIKEDPTEKLYITYKYCENV